MRPILRQFVVDAGYSAVCSGCGMLGGLHVGAWVVQVSGGVPHAVGPGELDAFAGGIRVSLVQAEPSQTRSRDGSYGSAYQPGAACGMRVLGLQRTMAIARLGTHRIGCEPISLDLRR